MFGWRRRAVRLRSKLSRASKPRLVQYYQSPKPPSPTVRRRSSSLKLSLIRLVRRLVWLTLAIAFIYNLILEPQPRLGVDSLAYRSEATYQGALAAELRKLTNRSKLTISPSSIQKNLHSQMPEVAQVGIDTPLIGRTPIVKLHIAAPALLLNAQSGLYLIDEQGIAVAKAETLPALKNLPRLEDQSGFPVSIGQPILNSTAINFVNNLIAQANRANAPIASLTLPPLAQQLDLRTSDRDYYVKFYLGGDALGQVGQWLAARHNFDASGQQPAEYLDVRVAGKIFFK